MWKTSSECEQPSVSLALGQVEVETGSHPPRATWHEKETVPWLLLQFGSYRPLPHFSATFTAIKDFFFKNLLAELKNRKSFLTFKFFKHLILKKSEETR